MTDIDPRILKAYHVLWGYHWGYSHHNPNEPKLECPVCQSIVIIRNSSETCWFCKRSVPVDALIAGYDTFDEQRLACLACNERMQGNWRPMNTQPTSLEPAACGHCRHPEWHAYPKSNEDRP